MIAHDGTLNTSNGENLIVKIGRQWLHGDRLLGSHNTVMLKLQKLCHQYRCNVGNIKAQHGLPLAKIAGNDRGDGAANQIVWSYLSNCGAL
jgi:hypothetical protein